MAQKSCAPLMQKILTIGTFMLARIQMVQTKIYLWYTFSTFTRTNFNINKLNPKNCSGFESCEETRIYMYSVISFHAIKFIRNAIIIYDTSTLLVMDKGKENNRHTMPDSWDSWRISCLPLNSLPSRDEAFLKSNAQITNTLYLKAD